MAITITIDNDTGTTGVQPLVADESSGAQLPSGSGDDGNEVNVLLSAQVGGSLSGFAAGFNSFLNGTLLNGFVLSDAQKQYAALNDGASSSNTFVSVSTTDGETISDLFFSDAQGAALNGDKVDGMLTLDGEEVFLWSNGDFCIATTSDQAGQGRIVAAFYLKDDATGHLSAQVQMVTFEPLSHPDDGDPDDALDFTDVMRVSAGGTISFDFDNLESGSFLWAAVGSGSAGLLVTGRDLDVIDGGPKNGEIVKGGGDPSDSVNTSQGGINATIGINSQHFADVSGAKGTKLDGPIGVFTLVSGFVPLANAAQATGIDVDQIDYQEYINAPSAKIFVSQVTGGTASMRITLWEAGGAGSDLAPEDLKPEKGYADTADSYSYIGNQLTDSHLTDDFAVGVASVTVLRGGTLYTFTSANQTQAGITVTISGNEITLTGIQTADTIGFAAVNSAGSDVDGTFNRFDIQALAGTAAFDVGRIDLDQGVSVNTAVGDQLLVDDDGPSITADSTGALPISDDETSLGDDDSANYAGNFTALYGTDGQAATPLIYSLSTPGGTSGLLESGTGLSVFLFKEGDDIVGRSGANAGAAASGTIVFVVSIDQTGEVTLDQRKAVVHDPNVNANDSTSLSSAGAVVINAVAYDGDGDHDDASLNIGQLLNFVDDAPAITAQILDGTVNFAVSASVSHSLNGAVHADINNASEQSLSGVYQYTIIGFNEPTAVFAGLDGVLSAGNTILTYYSDATHTTAVYRLSLDQTDGAAGSYTFEVLAPPPVTQTNFDFTDLPSGQNLFGIIAANKADLSKGGLLVMPNSPDINDPGDGQMTNVSGTVNTSKGGGPVTIGNGNQAFDSLNEGAFFCYVDNPLASAVGGLGLTQVTADDADFIDFNGTNEVTRASVEIVQASGGGTVKRPGPSLQVFAYDIEPGNIDTDAESRAFLLEPTATDTQSNIIACKILDSAGNVVEYRTNLQAGVSNGGTLAGGTNAVVDIQFILDAGGDTALDLTDDIYSVLVSNLKAGYTIEFVTEEGHDLALVEQRSGSFDIGGFNIFNNTNVPAQDFDFQVQISDYDNDTFASALSEFSVHVNGIIF